MSDDVLGLSNWLRSNANGGIGALGKENDMERQAEDEAVDQYGAAEGYAAPRSRNPKDWASEDAAENERLKREKQQDQPEIFGTWGKRGTGGTAKPSGKPVDNKGRPTKPTTPPVNNPDAVIAEDGQSLSQQTTWTQMSFRAKYGLDADKAWVREHNAELAKNRQLYGVSDPKAGTNPLAGAPTGTPKAPDRTIGAVAPPSTTLNPATPTTSPSSPRQYTTPTGQRLALVPNQPYMGPQPSAPGTKTPGQVPTTLPSASPSPASSTGTGSGTSSPSQPTTPSKPKSPSPLVSGARLGRWSTDSSPYYVNPDGTMFSRGADGELHMLGSNPDEYAKGLPIPPGDPNNPDVVTTPTSSSSDDMNRTIRMSRTEPTSQENWSMTVPDSGTVKPVTYLADLHVRTSGDGTIAEQEDRILKGIGGLIQGDPESAWAEAYLNDIARLAWAKQQADKGIKADPRAAPLDYIESWKDAFYGSDSSVPFVKDLDQQMVDHAVSRTPVNQPFNWKIAFGENGENGLISRQVASNDCGPNAFATMLRSRGYLADPATSFNYAKTHGGSTGVNYHNGDQFSGPYNMSRMLREEAGLESETKPVDWAAIDAELAAGRPVALSSGGHYWVVTAKRDTPNGAQYYTGATGAVVGNPEWARPDQIQYGGHPNYMVTAKGDVDPNSRAVREMGLRPPGTQNSGREVLSRGTRAAIAASQPGQQAQTQPLGANEEEIDPDDMYGPIIDRASKTYGVDRNLIKAIIMKESGGTNRRPDGSPIRSSAGAGGLMQITGPTAQALGIDDVDDPVQNIMGGTRYLKEQLDYFNGDIELALAAYNAGPGSVIRAGGIPDFSETKAYVPAVLNKYKYYQSRTR